MPTKTTQSSDTQLPSYTASQRLEAGAPVHGEKEDVLLTVSNQGSRNVPLNAKRDIRPQSSRVQSSHLKDWKMGAVAKLGGEQRRLSFSFPDGRCGWALSSRLAPESQRP